MPKDDSEAQILAFLRKHPGESGIVYRTTRADVEATAASLAGVGIKARPYHAGMANGRRKANQDAFNCDEINVIVATIAFFFSASGPGDCDAVDWNNDGVIDDLDLTELAVHWQQPVTPYEDGDADGDGFVDDLLACPHALDRIRPRIRWNRLHG